MHVKDLRKTLYQTSVGINIICCNVSGTQEWFYLDLFRDPTFYVEPKSKTLGNLLVFPLFEFRALYCSVYYIPMKSLKAVIGGMISLILMLLFKENQQKFMFMVVCLNPVTRLLTKALWKLFLSFGAESFLKLVLGF